MSVLIGSLLTLQVGTSGGGFPDAPPKAKDSKPAAATAPAVPAATPMPGNTKTQRIAFVQSPAVLPQAWNKYLDPTEAKMLSPAGAKAILSDLGGSDPGMLSPEAYFIFHVLRWSDPAEDGTHGKSQKVDKQHWYVFRLNRQWTLEEFSINRRMYGTRALGFVAIHLNRQGSAYDMQYEIDVKKKTPANVANLFSALQLFASPGGEAVQTKVEPQDVFAAMTPTALWYSTSDISVVGKVRVGDSTYEGALNSEPAIFDNEGLHRWDVSVAVPIRTIKSVAFDDAGQAITVPSPNRTNLFAVVNLYPARVDVKNEAYSLIPYLLLGVGVQDHPWNRILVGAGFGPSFAQFFVGVTLEKIAPGPVELGGSWWKQRDKQFAFGINVPVKGVKAALAKKATPAGTGDTAGKQ